MDIRKPNNTQTDSIKSQEGGKQKARFKAGVVPTADGKLMLPPGVQTKLTVVTAKYGVPCDLSNIKLDGTMAENVKTTRKIADVVLGDAKLLPELLKQIRRLMKAEIKLAQFYRAVTTESVNHQQKIDKYTADIFLKMAGYESGAKKLEHRTNVRAELKEKRTEAYGKYYTDSVFGTESEIIDAEFSILESNTKVLGESKAKRLELDNERKQKINQYVESAYLD